MVGRLSGSMAEDYVRVLWKAEERGSGPVTTREIAAALGVTNTTVSTNLRRLDAEGLLHHEPYHHIALTDDGRRLALAVVRRHRLIETFLHDRLGYAWDEVDEEAEVLEHSVSDLFVDRLADYLGSPDTDPHGDPIPGADGTVRAVAGRDLTVLPVGHTGTVTRVLDDEPGALRWLTEHAISLGSELTVVEHLLGGAVHRVQTTDGRVDVPDVVARAVWM